MKPRHVVLGAALALAAGLVIFGDSTPAPQVVEPAERAAGTPARPRAEAERPLAGPELGPEPGPGPGSGAGPAIAPLVARDTLIGGDDRFGDDASGLFARHDWTPPPPPPSNAAPPPPPPPSAPPLPFTFIGKSLQDGAWEIYLARGERTYLVRDGATLDGTYRVDAIRPPTLTLTYLPLDQVQQLNIGVFD